MMQTRILKTQTYPKMIQEFAESNFNLKVLSAGLLGLTCLMMILVLYLVKRGPQVIALDTAGAVTTVETKITDLQIMAAAREYMNYRYSWTDKSIASQLKKAEFFVLPSLLPAYERAMVDVQKFVREKKVSQRVYPKSVMVDLKQKKIQIVADRITEFDNLKAATEMHLTLFFEVTDRTVINPWGIYIAKEVEGGGS